MASASDTSLWLCLHLPRLGLEIFTRSLADGAGGRPVVLVDTHQVVQVNGTGRARGLQPGMSLSTAESICADLAIAWRDPERETATLERLAAWAYRFTPRISPEPPDVLLLELAGSLRLFRGLDRLQHRILEGLTALGYSAIPGVAPTPLAARALAISGRTPEVDRLADELEFDGRGDHALRQGWCRAVARAARPALMHMPLVHLGRPRTELEKFEAMGLSTLGEVLRLPRAPLGRRFGAGLLDHLDRLTARKPDPRPALIPPETFASTVHFLEDLEHTSALAFPMQRLVGELEDWLRLRQRISDRLDWILSHPRHGEHCIRVHFATPQRDRARMLEFSRLQLEREPGLPGVASLTLRVTRLTSHAGRDQGLFPALGEDGGSHEDPAVLVDLLHARFGPEVCSAIAPADDHRPEHAWMQTRPKPPKAAGQNRKPGKAGGTSTIALMPGPAPGPRPIWLLAQPRRLSEQQGLPHWHGPLLLCRGPERIDVGWWEGSTRSLPAIAGGGDAEARSGAESIGDNDPDRRSDPFAMATATMTVDQQTPVTTAATLAMAPPAPRDYWVARHDNGAHYWVYQELASGKWFLHGIFA